MNSMNDECFFDLAMKVIARQSSDAERAELEALLERQPELKAELERLQKDARLAQDAFPLVNATETTAGELPAYARGRLQTKVRQTLGRPPMAEDSERARERNSIWAWRWALGLAVATAVVALMVLPAFKTSSEPVIRVAMLDVGGTSRGTNVNEMAALEAAWKDSRPEVFARADELEAWEKKWPAGKTVAVKVVYDKAAGEVRVVLRRGGGQQEKIFLVERDLAATLQQAGAFIQEELKR
jgi:hypothetical protein